MNALEVNMNPVRPVPACRIVVRRRANYGALLAALIVAAGTPGAMARQDGGTKQTAAEAPLGGPAVEDRAPPGDRPFGNPEGGKGAGKFAQRGAKHGMFLRAVADLDGPMALTDEQEKQLREIEGAFREQMKAFRDEHAEEFKALRESVGGGGRGGEGRPERGKRDGANVDPKMKEAREKMRALMEKAPKPDESQARMWAVLTDEQRGFVKARMEDMGKQAREGGPRRGGDEMMDRPRERRRGGPEGDGARGGPREPRAGGDERPRRGDGPRRGGERRPPMPPPKEGPGGGDAMDAPPPPPPADGEEAV